MREYLTELVWDGVSRADSLFIHYLGAEDTTYIRQVTRKALLGAVARIFLPGCKHDQMIVLVGPQGCRKSTTLAKLGGAWFSDSLYTMSGKEAYEQLQGSWIIEVAEMAASRKAEAEQIKQFLSKQEDTYRAAYARRTQTHPRQCAFFGTTNDYEFLRDSTGARRFWPVAVTAVEKGAVRSVLTQDVVDQVWAEMVVAYDQGEVWYLDPETEALAVAVQKEHTESNGKQGLIEKFLETLLPEDWESRGLELRQLFWSGEFGGAEEGVTQRQCVCALEIWTELFHGDAKQYTQGQAREINNMLRQIGGWEMNRMANCGELYGNQRGFVRVYPSKK